MSTIVTRAGKGSPLTNTEVDNNFTNLNTDKVEKSGDTLTGDLAFGDNVKAKFGASDDLQIYHDGSTSYIKDAGTGNLDISTNGSAIRLVQGNGNRLVTAGYGTAGVKLWYGSDDTEKLATTSTGIDVTGTVTADDEIIVDGASGAQVTIRDTGRNGLQLSQNSTGGGFIDLVDATENLHIRTQSTNNIRIQSSGDISFYDDAGTSQDFYWDASTSKLGLGTTTPSGIIHATSSGVSTFVFEGADVGEGTLFQIRNATNNSATGNGHRLEFVHGNNNSRNVFFRTSSTGTFGRSPELYIGSQNDSGGAELDHVRIRAGGDVSFYNDDSTSEDFYWDASTSRLGIGTTSPSQALHVKDGAPRVYLEGTSASSLDAEISRVSGTLNGGVVGDIRFLRGSNDAQGKIQLRTYLASGFINSSGLVIDQSGNVGINTTDPEAPLEVAYTTSAPSLEESDAGFLLSANNTLRTLFGADPSSPYAHWIQVTNSSGSAAFPLALNPQGGNVGIGTTSPSARLDASVTSTSDGIHVTRSAATRLKLLGDGTIKWGASANQGDLTWDTGLTIIKAESGNALAFKIGNSEAARIDSSGNLLVGHTSVLNPVQNGGSGVSLRPGGNIYAGSTAPCLFLNRENSDGEIAQFRKDGTTVGSIGVDYSDNLFLSGNSSHSGLLVGTESIAPYADGAARDASEDLGTTTARWRNLYLSGGVYLGGTGSANLLDDYEEGTWTPVYEPSTGSFTTMTMDATNATYTKIGDTVRITAYIRTDDVDTTGGSGSLRITGLPFVSSGYHAIAVSYSSGWSTHPKGVYTESSQTYAVVTYETSSTGALSGANTSLLATGTTANANRIILSGVYKTSA